MEQEKEKKNIGICRACGQENELNDNGLCEGCELQDRE